MCGKQPTKGLYDKLAEKGVAGKGLDGTKVAAKEQILFESTWKDMFQEASGNRSTLGLKLNTGKGKRLQFFLERQAA